MPRRRKKKHGNKQNARAEQDLLKGLFAQD